MDKTSVLAISSIVLMICTNIFLRMRFVTMLKASGLACGVLCFATLFSIGIDHKILLVVEGLALIAAAEVIYFSDILKYTNNSYIELSKKFKLFNVLFYALSTVVILLSSGLYMQIYEYFSKFNVSVLLLIVFVKLIVGSSLVWNRGNIYFASKPPVRNDKKLILKYVDFLAVVVYFFAFMFGNSHNQIVLLLLAIILVITKLLNILLFTKIFTNAEYNTRISLTSVFSLVIFMIISAFGIIMCL